MYLLENENQIRAAIATMHPVARVAAQNLANHLLENPELLQDDEKCEKAFFGSCAFAMQQNGWDLHDRVKVDDFLENHGHAVSNVAVSIVRFAITQAEKKRKWGWLGKAAAFTGGVIVASLFG